MEACTPVLLDTRGNIDLSLGSLTSGGNLTANAGGSALASIVNAGNDVRLTAVDDIDVTDLEADHDIAFLAAGRDLIGTYHARNAVTEARDYRLVNVDLSAGTNETDTGETTFGKIDLVESWGNINGNLTAADSIDSVTTAGAVMASSTAANGTQVNAGDQQVVGANAEGPGTNNSSPADSHLSILHGQWAQAMLKSQAEGDLYRDVVSFNQDRLSEAHAEVGSGLVDIRDYVSKSDDWVEAAIKEDIERTKVMLPERVTNAGIVAAHEMGIVESALSSTKYRAATEYAYLSGALQSLWDSASTTLTEAWDGTKALVASDRAASREMLVSQLAKPYVDRIEMHMNANGGDVNQAIGSATGFAAIVNDMFGLTASVEWYDGISLNDGHQLSDLERAQSGLNAVSGVSAGAALGASAPKMVSNAVSAVSRSIPKGVTVQRVVQRAVAAEYVEGAWRTHAGNIGANHRYSGVGRGAVYTSTSEKALLAELRHYGISPSKVTILSREVKLGNVLDLTNPSVRQQLGITLEQITANDYGLTQAIGDFAITRYSGLLVPSARIPGEVNLVIFP